MEFETWCEYAKQIEETDGDLDSQALVSELFAKTDTDDCLRLSVLFIQGRLFPAWKETKLGVGPSTCYEVVARAASTDIETEDVEQMVADEGDIGLVAGNLSFGEQQSLAAFGEDETTLTVSDVGETLHRVAHVEGSGSHETRVNLLFGLLSDASSLEARFLSRLILEEVRIGVGEGTVRDAIADAFDIPIQTVSRAIQVRNDCGEVATIARNEGQSGVEQLDVELGRPIQSMLAQDGGIEETLSDWGSTSVEWKFDGARVQIHYDGETSLAFTRNMEEVTDALPDVVSNVAANLSVPAILDGEVIPVDEDGNPEPFQEVLKRLRREEDVEEMKDEVPVTFYAFDALYADEHLLDQPAVTRHETLEDIFEGHITPQFIADTVDDVWELRKEALENGHEGVMLKDPNSTYTPGKRGKEWRKIKPEAETLDLVITGGEWGEGRRSGLIGTFEIAARSSDGLKQLGKVATGFTDKELERMTEILEPRITSEDGKEVSVKPEVVVEVGYEEIQASPDYDSGYGLRFPRFVSRRGENGEMADTLEKVERLFDKQ